MPTKLALLLLSVLPLAAQASQPLIPVDHFTEEYTYSDPVISPDGKHLAVNIRMLRNQRMIPTMNIFTLPDLKRVSTIALPAWEIPVGFRWISNQRLAVKKGLEVGLRVAPVPTGEIVAVNLDGTDQQYLFGYKNYKQSTKGTRYGDDEGYGVITHVPHALDGHLLVGTHEWGSDRTMLYDIDSLSSSRRLLANIPHKRLDFLVQQNGKPRFASGIDQQNDPVLFRLDDASGKWNKVNMKEGASRYYPLTFSPDDSSVFVSHSPNGGPYALLKEDMATGQRTLIAGEEVGNLKVEFTSRPRIPFMVASTVGIPTPRYLDENHADAKLHKTLSEAFPGASIDFVSFSNDGKRLLFWVGSDRDPGSYYLFDRDTAKAALLFSNMEKIDVDRMAERRPFSFKARDGLAIHGYLTLPANPGKKKLPMVLLPHGGPFGISDGWHFDVDAQFLASRGYAVLQTNFRGSGGRGDNFEEAGYRQYGGKMMDDLIDSVKWATAQPDIDGGRVCVYGASFGGYAALMLPVREPSMFKCAVGYAGRYDLYSRFGQESNRGEKDIQNYLTKTMGADKAELDKQSPTTLAAQIKLPVLLVHGGNDKTTELGQAVAMRNALIGAGNPAEWVLEADEGHGFYDAQRRKQFYQRLEAFLGRHLGK